MALDWRPERSQSLVADAATTARLLCKVLVAPASVSGTCRTEEPTGSERPTEGHLIKRDKRRWVDDDDDGRVCLRG